MRIDVSSVSCSGCGICVVLCPRDALKLSFSAVGHLRPTLNKSLCVDCGLCARVCPFVDVSSEREVVLSSFTASLIGKYVKVGLAWSTDERVRFNSASGGAATSILKYLLEERMVDAVLVPRIWVKRGMVFGRYEVVYDPKEVINYAGSIYAPVDITKALKEAFKKGLHIALVGLPCQIRGLRKSFQYLPRLKDNIKLVLGLYCNNTPSSKAAGYAVKTLLKVNPEKVSRLTFRGHGWPGYAVIATDDGRTLKVSFPVFWGSGLGQYFYGRSCLVCPDHAAELADISLADPWTYQRGIGTGKTLAVIRTKLGLEVLVRAVESGYLRFEEIPGFYAVQYTTLLKETVKVIGGRSFRYPYVIPPSITTVLHEIDYLVGGVLARDERLWSLLRLYTKARHYIFKPLVALDYFLKLGFSRVLAKISKAWIVS
ncbi:MAG: Coenzyme F420 hydrogenase/dehydrogenase, beta subunit C-terminal domain [Desulfurococcaceae archaeon]